MTPPLRRRLHASRYRRDAATDHDQRGFTLLSVVVVMGLISILGAVLISMSLTALDISAQFRERLDLNSAADGAMQSVIHQLQSAQAAAGQDCFESVPHEGHANAYEEVVTFPDGGTMTIIVACETKSVTTLPTLNPRRDVELVAYPSGSSDAVGKARAVILDGRHDQAQPGVETRICDWQIGRNVAATTTGC